MVGLRPAFDPLTRATSWALWRTLGAGLAVTTVVVACSSPSGAVSSDPSDAGGSTSDDASEDASAPQPDGDASTFTSAPHAPPPALTPHTTKVFATPQVVTVTYAGFASQDEVEAFGDFVVGSKWLETVGRDYGVGHGTHASKLRLSQAAPATLTDAQIVSLLKKHIGDGSLPAPSASNGELVFLVYVPGTTKVNDGAGAIMCADDYYGYHAASTSNGVRFAYAVLPDCDGNIDTLTSTASHELIESATDPEDGWYLSAKKDDAWWGLDNAEVADLCEWTEVVREGGFALQRSWSIAAAAAGENPCVPIAPGTSAAMMGVTAAPAKVVTLKPGASTTFTLTGWSSEPMADWKLKTIITDDAEFDPDAHFSATTINNGGTVTVTLTVPKTNSAGDPVASGQMGSVMIFSGDDADRFSPVTVVAQ